MLANKTLQPVKKTYINRLSGSLKMTLVLLTVRKRTCIFCFISTIETRTTIGFCFPTWMCPLLTVELCWSKQTRHVCSVELSSDNRNVYIYVTIVCFFIWFGFNRLLQLLSNYVNRLCNRFNNKPIQLIVFIWAKQVISKCFDMTDSLTLVLLEKNITHSNKVLLYLQKVRCWNATFLYFYFQMPIIFYVQKHLHWYYILNGIPPVAWKMPTITSVANKLVTL